MALFTTAVSADQDLNTYLQSTNHVTLSLRFGLNIHSKLTGIGNGFGATAANGRLTPFGDPYNYNNGYVYDKPNNANGLPTSSYTPNPDNAALPGFTTYWGYDNQQLVSAGGQLVGSAGAYTGVALSRSSSTGIPSEQSGDEDSQNAYPGFELSYDRDFGKKENWHDMHYGIEGAVNYMKITLNNSGTSAAGVSTTTDIYNFPITLFTPPQFDDSSIASSTALVIPLVPGASTTTSSSGTFSFQNQFEGDLWGFRLGPYVDFPMSEKWSLHLSGGLALGLLDDNDNWAESLNTGTGTLSAGGQGTDFKMLWGYYISLDAAYQFNKRWGVEGGVQFQDLGQYSHSFSGRTVSLDLSQSLFVQVGVSYSF